MYQFIWKLLMGAAEEKKENRERRERWYLCSCVLTVFFITFALLAVVHLIPVIAVSWMNVFLGSILSAVLIGLYGGILYLYRSSAWEN